jgi:GDP-4-dehydro-6-deoxy-D-mannose reductase
MRAFLTGASGFVGSYLIAHLEACGDEVFCLDDSVDLGATSASPVLSAALADATPDVIYHLAALTHVGRSWDDPTATMQVNIMGTLTVLEAARQSASLPRVLLVSSAEVYGAGEGVAITEQSPLRPVTPYAASKVAAEFLGLEAFLGRGLEVVRARPFNHVGPGQGEAFVVSALARRIAEIERSGGGSIPVGNLAAARDFTDVRDVVRAYRLLAELGVAGEVYNVCSGEARTIQELFDILISNAEVPIHTHDDAELFRPIDVPVLIGDATKIAELCGWKPEIEIDETLAAVLEEWRKRLE